MRWSVTIPGQPVSLDHAYETKKIALKRRGTPVLRDGEQRYIHRPGLTDAGLAYRNDVQLLVQNAKPSKFRPTGQVRVALDLYLAHDMDADNVLKLILDGAEKGTGINDMRFLPCIRTKEVVGAKHARVEIYFDDDPNAH